MILRLAGGAITAIALAVVALIPAGCAPCLALEGQSPRPFLWKAQSETATVYILGSLHIARSDLYPLDPVIEQAFEESEYVVFEIPMDLLSQLRAMNNMVAAAMLPEGESLSDHLTPRLNARLAEYLERNGLKEEVFERLRPWFVAMSITIRMSQKEGYDARFGIERHFLKKIGGREMLALETAEEQLALLSGFSVEQELIFLQKTLIDAENAVNEMDTIARLWKQGDPDALDRYMRKSFGNSKEMRQLYKVMLTDRNRRMTDKIEGFLRSKGAYFVVVGAGHPVGKEGIVELLCRRQILVQQQ